MIARAIASVRSAAVLAAFLASLATACQPLSQPWGSVQIGGGEPIRIGLLTNVDGSPPASTRELPALSVDGHAIEIVQVPVHCAAETATETAPDGASLVGLTGVIGAGCSSACVYAESLLFQQKTTLVASGCTATALVQDGYPLVFRIAWDDADQALVAADYTRSGVRATTADVVSDQTAYGRVITAAYTDRFKSRGGQRVDEVDIPTSGPVDVPQIAAQLEATGAKVAFLAIARPDAASLFEQLQAALPGTPVLATDTVFAPGGSDPSGLVALGLSRGPRGWSSELSPGPTSPDLFAAQDQDALAVYARAIAKVARTERDGTLEIPRQALRDAIARTNFIGATGRIRFDAGGDRLHDVGAALYRLGEGEPVQLAAYRR